MYDFSLGILDILENVKKRSFNNGVHTIGSEYLLIELMNLEDGIFRFLMSEYDVKPSEVQSETDKLLIVRKEKGLYSETLEQIFTLASKVSYGKIKEEHLLYGVLETKNSIAVKLIMNLGLSPNDLLLDLKEIYDFKDMEEENVKYTISITKKAKDNELDGLFEYDNYLKKLEVILNKKYKNNPLIIGEAGVGKTAIVEGFAAYALKKNLNYEILSLNLSQMLSNTKYRGDFEGRIEETLQYVKNHPNVILFIDEIHTIMGAGHSENSLDAANILKPFLARSDIKIIGATTTTEYHKTIYKDKALRRRFDPILVKEPDLYTTKKIIKGLKSSYEKYHQISINDELLDYLIEESDKGILNKAKPDKCIDILDETMSYAHCNNIDISKDLIDSILAEHIGYKKENCKLNYPELNKLEFLKINNLKEKENYNYYIGIIENDGLFLLKKDLKYLFGINEEMTLELDLKQYQDYASIQSLIGAPPGYVGYQDEGLLSKQITKFPMTLLILKNVELMSLNFKMLYDRILNDGFFYDNCGNKISTKHLIILEIIKNEEDKRVGFLKDKKKEFKNYDLLIKSKKEFTSLNDEYEQIFNKYKLNIQVNFDISKSHQKQLNDIIYNLLQDDDHNFHEIGIKDSLVTLIK